MDNCMYCGKPLINGKCDCWSLAQTPISVPPNELSNFIQELKQEFNTSQKLVSESSPEEMKLDIAITLSYMTNYLIALYTPYYPEIYDTLIETYKSLQEKIKELKNK